MKFSLLLFFCLSFSPISRAEKKEYFIYFHGLNSNIDSVAYHSFFRDLKQRGKLFRPKLPGHQKMNDQHNMEPTQIKSFMLKFLSHPAIAQNLDQTTIIAHSMSAIILKNHLSIEVKNKFKKIIYYAPSAPPKYYFLFSLLTKWLPDQMQITSRSPKNLRLNDYLLVKNYVGLFKEVELFLTTPQLLPNEEIRIHEEDEVTNVPQLKSIFPGVRINTKKCKVPKHAYFLDPLCV